MKILILLSLLSASAFGFVNPMDDVPVMATYAPGDGDKMNKKLVAAYCIQQAGSAPETLTEFKFTSDINCTHGRSALYFYEAWKDKYVIDKNSIHKISTLDPSLTDNELAFYKVGIAGMLLPDHDSTCSISTEKIEVFRTCPGKNQGKKENITKRVVAKMAEPNFEYEVTANINTLGEKSNKILIANGEKPEPRDVGPVHIVVDKDSPPGPVTIKTTDPVVVAPVVKVTPEVKVSPSPKDQDKDEAEPDPVITKSDEADIKSDPDCTEELNKEIADLLADDEKNIIGLQYELTVLKMAALATESKTNSIEGVIRQQSKKIDAIDDGIINKMNVMYKKHGLPEDAAAISSHLKQKSSSANYFAKDKRFFNQDSSAFLLAYQGMNEDSGIKDSDVSVLWFMDKVSEKAKSQSGKYSAAHNLTNLSTRLAQYTSAIDPKKALSKPVLDEMVKKQNGKIEDEFLQLIQNFKTSNPACYASLFSDSDADTQCNLNLVEDGFSQLLAINSRIKSTDLVSIDSRFNGGIDKARFSLSKYVDGPERVTKNRPRTGLVLTTEPEPNPAPLPKVEEKVVIAPKADNPDPVKEEEEPLNPDQFKPLHFTVE